MKIAIYNVSTGEINRRMIVPVNLVANAPQPGESIYLNCPPWATHIINNEPTSIAPLSPTTEELLAKIRIERNLRLTACDWTQLPDAPVDAAAWVTYRQALRDFPATCDPTNPVWPVQP